MNQVKINILSSDESLIPTYETDGASGADLRSAEDGVIAPGEIKLVKTGIKIELPIGYEAQIRPRSGLALKHGISLVNSPGTIDSDYRGEIGIIMTNLGKVPFEYKKGDRIAQMVIASYTRADFQVVKELSDTVRGQSGFGHTGK